MKTFVKNNIKHIASFTITILYIVCVYFCINIHFSTNDDRFMGELLSGSITGKPETHLVYVNYLLSLALSLLYKISLNISWFGIMLVFFHGFSCFCILDSFFSKSKTKLDYFVSIILVGLLFSTQLYLISKISYTITATFMAVAGYIALFFRENKKTRLGYFILLELLAILLRDKAMLMIQPLGFAVYIGLVLTKQGTKLKTKFIELFKIAIVIIFIAVFSITSNKLGYLSEEWKTYNEYNKVRTTLFDYTEFAEYDEVSHILEKYNVSENEYNGYKNYAILDYSLSLDCIKELANYMENKESSYSLSTLFNDFKIATFQSHYWKTNILLLFGWICTLAFIVLSGNLRGLLSLGLLFISRNIIWFYLLYEGRLPLRISMPLFACELVLLCAIIFYYYRSKPKYKLVQKLSLILIGFVLCIVGLWSAKIQFTNFKLMNQGEKIYMKGLEEVLDYCNSKPENKYILDTFSFMWYNGNALSSTFYGKRNYITAGNWFSNSPSALEGNTTYLSDTEDGFYFIMLSESESTDEEMTNPIVLYLSEKTSCEPTIIDTFTASHGGIYSVIYFDKELKLNLNP